MRAILGATLLCVLRSGLIHGAIMKKVPGLGYIYNSSWPQTRRPTTEPSGEFDPNLSIQQLMNAEKRYHAIRIPEKIYMQVKYNIYNETEPPWMVKFMADAQRIVDLRKNTTMYFDFSTGKPKNNTYVPKRVFHRRRNYFLHGPPTTYDPNLPELYWTHYLKDFEPNSRGEIIVGGWKKKEVITRGPKRVDLRLKGARAQLAEGDIWGIYAHLLTPTRKIKWTPNIMKPDFNFDHQVMFDPTEANTFWILPATKSWELFDIQDPYHTTRPPQMFIPAWLRGEGLDPQKKGRGGLYNIGGTAYREWEVPVKYRSLSPELVSKYYMMFDDKGRRIAFNRTLPAKWGTVPYGKTFTYRLDITNDDGSINKTIWKRNAGYVTKPDGSLLMVKDLRPEEKLRYLGPEATPRELATRRVNCTHADGSFNYSTIEHETIKTVTYPTAWLNFTNANGSYMRLWKYVKPAITTKYFIKKTTNPVDEPTETVRFTHPNGSLHKVFWKFARYTTPPANITRETTPSDQAYAFAKKAAPHKEFEIITYPDGGFNYTTQYSPSIINRTAPDGSILFSYFYVPKYLRANASSTVDYKLITNRYGEVIKVVTYRPKLFHLVTNDDGSLNYSEKVANFDQLKAAHYGANFYTVNHLFSNGSVERTNFVHAEEFTTPPPRKYYGYAQTKILNFTRDDGAVLGTFWKIVKNMGAYAGTGSTMMYTFKNKRGGVAHSFWREVPKFTNRDELIKDDDVTEIRYVTRRDGFLYGSFKKKLRLYTTPVFRPYTGNMSTRVGYFTYPNGTVYGSHWQVDKNTTNPFNATRNPFFRSVIFNAITRLNYIDRVVYHTDYQGQIRYSYKKRFTFAGRSTPTQFQYTGRRLTRLLKFTDTMGKVYGSHWVFDDLRRPTTVAPVTVPNTTRRNPYFTYKGPRPTRIVNYTNAKGERLASFWLFVTDPFDLLNRSTTTLPPLVTPNKHYNAFYFDPGYVSTVEPPRTHSEYARLKDIEVETELPFSTYGPNETRATELTARSTHHDEQSTSQLSRVEGSDASTTHSVEVDLTVKSTLAEETIVPTTTAVTGGDETAKETTRGEEAVTEAITKLTEIVTTTSGPTTEPDVQYVSDSTQEETPAMVKEGPYFPGRDRERRAVKSNQNNPHLRLRKRSVHIMGNNPSPIVRDSEGREGREGRVHNIAERSNAAFFRRAYSGGKVACDRFRRDAEDVDLIGRDLFDQQQESGGPEGPGGGLFDSFDLPNVQRAKKGKEAVDEKLIEDVTFKDDEDDVKATAVDADDEIDEGAVDGGDRSGDDTSSSDDVDNGEFGDAIQFKNKLNTSKSENEFQDKVAIVDRIKRQIGINKKKNNSNYHAYKAKYLQNSPEHPFHEMDIFNFMDAMKDAKKGDQDQNENFKPRNRRRRKRQILYVAGRNKPFKNDTDIRLLLKDRYGYLGNDAIAKTNVDDWMDVIKLKNATGILKHDLYMDDRDKNKMRKRSVKNDEDYDDIFVDDVGERETNINYLKRIDMRHKHSVYQALNNDIVHIYLNSYKLKGNENKNKQSPSSFFSPNKLNFVQVLNQGHVKNKVSRVRRNLNKLDAENFDDMFIAQNPSGDNGILRDIFKGSKTINQEEKKNMFGDTGKNEEFSKLRENIEKGDLFKDHFGYMCYTKEECTTSKPQTTTVKRFNINELFREKREVVNEKIVVHYRKNRIRRAYESYRERQRRKEKIKKAAEEKINKRILENDQLLFKLKDRLKNKGKKLKALKMKRDLRKFESSDDINREYNDKVDIGRGNVKCKAGVRKKRHVFLLEPSNEQGMKKSSAEIRKLREVMGEDYDKGLFKRCNRKNVVDMIQNRRAIDSSGNVDPEGFKTLTPSKTAATAALQKPGNDYEDREAERDNMEELMQAELKKAKQMTTKNPAMDALKQFYLRSLTGNENKNKRKKRNLSNSKKMSVYNLESIINKDQSLNRLKREIAQSDIKQNDVLSFRHKYSGGPIQDVIKDTSVNSHQESIKGHAIKHRAKRQENRTKSWASCFKDSIDLDASPPSHITINMFTHPPYSESNSNEPMFDLDSDISKYDFIPTPLRTTRITTRRIRNGTHRYVDQRSNFSRIRNKRMVTSSELVDASSHDDSKDKNTLRDNLDGDDDYDVEDLDADPTNRTAVKIRVKRQFLKYSCQREYLSQFPEPSGSYFVRQKAVRKAQKSRMFFKNMSRAGMNSLADKDTSELNRKINDGFQNINSDEARYVYMGHSPFSTKYIDELREPTKRCTTSSVVGNERKPSVYDVNTEGNSLLHSKTEETSITSTTIDLKTEVSSTTLDVKNQESSTVSNVEKNEKEETKVVLQTLDLPSQIIKFGIDENRTPLLREIGDDLKDKMKGMCYANPEFMSTQVPPIVMKDGDVFIDNKGHFPSTLIFMDKTTEKIEEESFLKNELENMLTRNIEDLLQKTSTKKYKYIDDKYKIIDNGYQNQSFLRKQKKEPGPNSPEQYFRDELSPFRVPRLYNSEYDTVSEWRTCQKTYLFNTASPPLKKSTPTFSYRKSGRESLRPQDKMMDPLPLQVLMHVFPPYVFEINSTNVANEPVTQYQRFKNIEELEKFTDRRKIISMRDLKLKHVTRWIFNGTNKSRYINENFLFENRTVYKTSDIIETIDNESKKLKKLEDYISKMKAPKTRKYNVITLTTQTNIVTKKYKVTRFIFLNKTIDKKMKDFSRKYVFHENPDTSPWMKIRPRIMTNKYKFYINSTPQNIKTTQNNKHISLDNSIKNDENWKKTEAESLQQEKEKILKELNIKSDTLKCHNFSLYDLQLLKQLRQNKENSKKMSSFENQILEFFNRPELRAQKSEELTTTKKPTTFHITDDDDEYINDETTTHVDTEERNIRYDVVQEEVDPHDPSEKKYSRKENREEFIKLIKQKLHKEQNQKRNSVERSMIKNFDGNMVEKSSITDGQISEKIVHNSREKREINPNVGENCHQNIRKQYSGGVFENSKIITDKIKNVDTYNYNTENTILGQLANIVIKRINNKVRNKRSRLTSQKNIESSILEPLNTKKIFAKQKRSLAKDLSLRAKELFETFETINPYNKRKRKLNESQSAKWSISESNDSSSIESEDSLRSWVVPEPFDTFKQTFPSGSVLDPAEFSTRGSTSGVTWGVKEFDNFEAYDISKKMGKTRKPFHINYFDEEMRREDELMRKGLLSTTTYKTPQPIDKNEYYSFSDDKSRELCRVFVTSDVVSNIMEKYKLTSTRSLKELMRFTYFYNIYKKNQTKPSPKTTKAFRWEYVKINVNKDGESIKRDKREVVAVKPNQKYIVFDPNRSFEEVNPNLFLKTEPQTVKQGIRNMHTVYIPRKSTKRDGIKRISFGNLIVLSKYRKNAKYYQYRNVITTRRNFKQHFLNLLDKSHNKRRNVLVVPKNVKTIETRKGIRILNEYLIVREKTTTPFIKNRFKNQSVGFDLSAAHGENLQKLEDCEMFKKFIEGNENVNTAKPRSLKDMILNKTEDEILWQGWLKARENESFMDTEDRRRFKRDIDDEESQLNFNQKRQYKGFVHRLSTKKSTYARNYSAYLKNLIDSPYNELLNKKTQYEGKQKQESQNDYEEYQKLYNAKRAERQNKVKYFSPGEKADENYIARMAPNHKAVYDQGRNFYKNQRQQTQPEGRPVNRFLKIYTEVEVHNPYYSNLNIYNEAEWKRYDVVVDDSRINDRFIEEEIEKRPTVKPLLITQVFQSNRYSKLLHKKDNRMKRALKRRRDLSNWNIIEHTAPSDPPDDNFDFNTITPFPTEKPKRPGKTPYADSAIFNDPDSDTEENRQRFETDMRDFFGSDIETMTEIELEKKRIRENFIKQLEEKERKEKEQKEKETDAAKQTNDPQEKHMQKNEHLNNPANHPRKQRSVFLKKLEGELSNPQRKQNSILIEKVEHALKFKRDLSNWNIIEHTAPSDPPDDNFDFNTITPFPTEKPKRPGKTPYADSAIFNDPDSDTEENRQRFETDMRDFFASDIETMTEIELEKKRIRENFIKQLEEKERKEKEQKEKETEVAKHTNAHMQENEHLNNPANHPRKQRSVLLKNLKGELSNTQRKQRSILIKKVEHALKFKRDLSNWNIIEHTAPSDPPDDNFDFNTITPFPTEKPKRPGKTPYADSAIFNDPDSDTEENRQRFETDMRDFFASDIETMTEIELEKKRIRENFIKQLEEKERKEKEQKEKETDLAKQLEVKENNEKEKKEKEQKENIHKKNEEAKTLHRQKRNHGKPVDYIRQRYSGGVVDIIGESKTLKNNGNIDDGNDLKELGNQKLQEDEQRIRAIYDEIDSSKQNVHQTKMKELTPTKDPLVHGQYLNFYQHMLKYSSSQFDQLVKMKAKVVKRQKRNENLKNNEGDTKTITTESYKGKFIPLNRVKRISDALFEVRKEYNITFATPNEKDITLIRTPARRRKRCLVTNDFENNNNGKLNKNEEPIVDRKLVSENSRRRRFLDQLSELKDQVEVFDNNITILNDGERIHKRSLRKFYMDNVDDLNNQAEQFYNNLTKDEAYLNRLRKEFNDEFREANVSKDELLADMVMRQDYNNPNLDAIIDAAYPNEGDRAFLKQPINRFDPAKFLDPNNVENFRQVLEGNPPANEKDENEDHNNMKVHGNRVRRFYMSSAERERLDAWNLYYNITGDETMMNNLREQWKKANTTGPIQHSVMRRHIANEGPKDNLETILGNLNNPGNPLMYKRSFQACCQIPLLKRQKRHFCPEKGPEYFKIRDWILAKFLNDTGRPQNYSFGQTFSVEESETKLTTLKIVTKKPKAKKKNQTDPLARYKLRPLEPLINSSSVKARGNKSNACAPSRKRRNINKEPEETGQPNINKGLEETVRPRKTTRQWPSTTLNLTVQAAIKRAKKEARKEGLMLEKWEQANKRELVEFEHFDEYPHEPFYIQKTTTEPVTVLSWEATETGEEVLGYDSYENLTLQDRFDEVNKSGELFYRIKGLSTVTVDLHVDRFQSFGPPVGPDGKFEDNWFQKLPDGRTFDRPVNLDFSSTTPEPEFYHKTEISLEELRQLREMYEQIPHMRKELVERVQGNEALLNPDMSAQDSKLLDTWQTTMRSGEIFYICATTIPNHRIAESIEAFRPDVLRNGEFEKNWFQLVDGKTYKRPVDLAAYYSLPSTKQVLTRTTKLVRVITDNRMAPEVYDEKAERFAKLMGYDDVEPDEKEKGHTGQKNDVEKEHGEKKKEHKKKSRRRREADCRRGNAWSRD